MNDGSRANVVPRMFRLFCILFIFFFLSTLHQRKKKNHFLSVRKMCAEIFLCIHFTLMRFFYSTNVMKIFCIQSTRMPSIQDVLHTISILGGKKIFYYVWHLHWQVAKDRRWENIPASSSSGSGKRAHTNEMEQVVFDVRIR